MPQCSAIIASGTQCTRNSTTDGLCGTHHRSKTTHGPNKFAVEQLKNKHVHEMETLRLRIMYREDITLDRRQHLFAIESRELHADQLTQIRVLRLEQENEILRTGVNPDRQAEQIRRERAAERREVRRERIRLINEEHARQREIEHQEFGERIRNILNPQRPPAPPVGRLQQFAGDAQNVHTREIVQQTKDIVAKVRAIPVPEAYRWKAGFVSPTVGEIMAECKLTSHAGAQLFNKYVSRETIYDMEEAIYAKVLDSVWQFVKNSPDKEDLCKIVKQELEDNVNMCAQGNLSRICNILAGYLDGIGSQESISERLGRLFPALMEIDDDAERKSRAEAVLIENAVPRDQWAPWMDAVMV